MTLKVPLSVGLIIIKCVNSIFVREKNGLTYAARAALEEAAGKLKILTTPSVDEGAALDTTEAEEVEEVTGGAVRVGAEVGGAIVVVGLGLSVGIGATLTICDDSAAT